MADRQARERISRESRRNELLRAAAAVFARSNYRAAGVAEIAREAGVSEPLLYKHFRSKCDIYCEVLERIGLRIVEIWEEATADIDDPLEVLRAAGEIYIRNLHAHPGEARLQFQALAEAADPEIAAVLRKTHKAYVAFFEDRIRRGQDAGVIRADVDPNTAAWLLDGTGFTFTMQDLLGLDDPTQRSDTMKLVLDWLAATRESRTQTRKGR